MMQSEVAEEYAALRKLVRAAYNEGFTEGMREHTSSRGGKPWPDSAAKKALERICFDCGDVKDCFMNCGPVKG
jgi:hypothetical protein